MVGLLLPVFLTSVACALWVGSIAGLRRLRIDWWPLALGAIAVQLVVHNPPFNQQWWALTWGPPVWVASLSVMLVVLVRNAQRRGPACGAWRLAAVGVGLNLFVVSANGGYMPQSAEARVAARGTLLPADANLTQLYNVAPIGSETRFAWLGDVFAQPSWLPRANVFSIGDLLLSSAFAWLAFRTIASKSTQVQRETVDPL